MQRSFLLPWRLVLSFVPALAGAGCADPAPSSDAAVADVPEASDLGAAVASQSIGPGGGTLFGPGVSLTVPPGALPSATTITVTRTDRPVPAGYVGYSPVYRFAPDGLTFARAATVDLTFVGDARRAGLYWSAGARGYERLAGTVTGDRVVGLVSHFSEGFVGDEEGADGGVPGDAPAADAPSADAPSADAPSADAPSADAPSADAPVADVPATDLPGAALPAPRPLSPWTGAHAPTRRPRLRWSLGDGTTGARVSVCRDRALSTGCVTFDAAGTDGAPGVDLAPGVWFWGLRGQRAGLTGAATSAAWRLFVGAATLAPGRPWGYDPDVNGDGFADVVAATDAGRVVVHLGGPSGPSATGAALTVPLDATGFGSAVDAAGDFDGDGYGDVVVGAAGSGTAYLFRGSAAGLAGAPTTLTGPRGSDFGTSVTGAGDMDGDGFGDVVVATSTDAVFVFRGGAGAAAPTLRVDTRTGAYVTVDGVGDVDGDGYGDVLLRRGEEAFLLLGGPLGYDEPGSRALTSNVASPAGDVDGDGYADLAGPSQFVYGAAAWPGRSVPLNARGARRAGDYNGDGYSDLAFLGPAPAEDRFTVYAGGPAGLPSSPVTYPVGFGSPGGAMTSGGDLDGDGDDDALSRRADGRIAVTPGGPAGLGLDVGGVLYSAPAALIFSPPTAMAAVGDVDRDGHADVVFTGGGALFELHRGSATGILETTAASMSLNSLDFTGSAVVAGAGDLDGDGFADVLVGALNRTGPAARAYFGAATGLRMGSATVDARGADAFALAGAGDLDHDGRADVVLSGATRPAFAAGAATGLRAAAPFGPTAAPTATLGAAGDVNHDGFDDVLLQRTPTGPFEVYAGSSAGPGATPLSTVPATGRAFAVGDVNGDGYADVAAVQPGGFAVFHGSAAGLATTASTTVPGSTEAVLAVGDVNRDGRGDVIATGGYPTLYLGSAAGLDASSGLTWFTSLRPAQPRGPAGYGDVDGDGTADAVFFSLGSLAVHRLGRAVPQPVLVRPAAGNFTTAFR